MTPPAGVSSVPVTVVTTGPQLTMENAHELLHLIRAVPETGTPRVVVDMLGTSALDSTGVGALVSSMRYVRQRRGTLVIANLQPELRRMLHVMNLQGFFDVYDSVEGAKHQVASAR
jgi:anti-sigma B factor antagonist